MTNDSWKGPLGLVLFAGLGVIGSLLAAPYIPLADPDEGLHAAIAQEMVEKGDWIVPRLLDEPFLDKPILYFWAIAASLKTLGMSEAAVRLPGLLFGMLGMKFITYIWPVFPATAILAATVWVRKIDGVLSEGAKRWMSRMVWFTCLIGSLGLPAVFTITQIALPMRFSLPACVLAVVAALTSLVPLWSWLRGRDCLALELAATTVCGQLIVLLWCVLPQIAEGLSGRDLAAYFNLAGKLPSRVLVVQERFGSVVFYLDRDLRSQLQPGQIANLNIGDGLPLRTPGTDEWIVIPERCLPTAFNDYDLSSRPFERAGRFRLYRRSDIELAGRAKVGG